MNLCPGEDSNLHALAGLSTSRINVYQFQHPGIFKHCTKYKLFSNLFQLLKIPSLFESIFNLFYSSVLISSTSSSTTLTSATDSSTTCSSTNMGTVSTTGSLTTTETSATETSVTATSTTGVSTTGSSSSRLQTLAPTCPRSMSPRNSPPSSPPR